jgi:hypothetical protein
VPLLNDHAAKEITVRCSVLPECLHVPIAAVDQDAIANYIGEIVRILVEGSPAKALLIQAGPPPEIDPRLPIWNEPRSALFHQQMQVWVNAEYRAYRRAYRKAFPEENITGQVLSHCMNRRHAVLKGFQYVRIVPASRAINSSSAFSENWGIETFSKPEELQSFKKRGVFIHYADLVDLMVMLDMRVGGGVMELVNEAQRLVEPVGDKTANDAFRSKLEA